MLVVVTCFAVDFTLPAMKEIVQHSDIFTVDARYVREELASIHLLRSDDRIAIIDTGTQHSIAEVEAALQELQLTFDNVDYIVLTHIHLDHAGGAGALMQKCRHAQLVVHAMGARHMVDPTKLIAGTVAVYGQAAFDKMYGDVLAIDEERILVPADGESVTVAGRRLTFLDSPGHARHHHCIHDERTNSVFTGDTLGISYPGLRHNERFFLMPTTTPVQFDPPALHASIDKVMSLDPAILYLTHYSAVCPKPHHISGLHAQIDEFVSLTERCVHDSEKIFSEQLTAALIEYAVTRCCSEIPELSSDSVTQWLSLDAKLNAQGLVFWWMHRRNSSGA